jgi:hypothetical protein
VLASRYRGQEGLAAAEQAEQYAQISNVGSLALRNGVVATS